MKKIYEAPKMMVEAVCLDEMIAASLNMFNGEEDPKATAADVLGKERNDSDWGNLW